jgi:serine/threonine-protein kinase
VRGEARIDILVTVLQTLHDPTCLPQRARDRASTKGYNRRGMASSSIAESDPIIGSMLGKDYLVLERIGVGGMAVVYLVEHQTLQKRFAAKVLSAQHASNADARARFTQEAHAASQLDHENIVSISDFGVTADGRPYFVMELLRGQTLADRLEDGPMTIEEVVAVGVPVARALAHAHAEGVIHRDVKPENIFLVQRSQGRWGVKVLDFGIARLPVNDRMTKTGEALGSPMYMSPEACRGEEVDPRADIYSFGIVLYLMLAGRVPFTDENLLKVLQMQVSSPLPLPSSFNPDLPPPLELVILRALAKDASERYATMDEFLFALEAALPSGSDALLIQAQFGTSTTPFPGTLERIRTSARMSTPPLNISITGQHQLSSSGSHRSLPITSPPAPVKRRRPLVAGLLLVLAGGGVGGYLWMQQPPSETKAAALPPPRMAAAAPVPTPTPAPAAAPVAVAQDPAPVAETPPAPPDVPVESEPPVETAKPGPGRKAPPPVRHTRATTRVAAVTRAPDKSDKRHGSAGSAEVVETAEAVPAPTPAVVVATPPVEAPASPPVAAPTPSPAPANPLPAPAPKPAAPAVVVGSMDAVPTVANLDVNGPLPNSVVRRAVDRAMPAVRACYRAAAAAQKKTPALKMAVTFEIDENSAATNVSANGGAFGSLSSCVRSAIGQITTQQAPDVGTAQVAVTIQFTPT